MLGRRTVNVPRAGYAAVFGPNWQASIKRAPVEAPDYMSALDLDFVRGQRIGYNGTIEPGTPTALAFDALVAAGAIMVERPSIPVSDVPALPNGYQQHKAIDEYYKGLALSAPINSLEEGPVVQAVRSLNVAAVSEARTLDQERRRSGPRGPLHGIPVLLDDSFDVRGLPTTAGSIALQNSLPADDAAVVAQLRAAGAIILGKTNVTELNGRVRRQPARGLLVPRRPGAAAVGHRQDACGFVGGFGRGDFSWVGGLDDRHGDRH